MPTYAYLPMLSLLATLNTMHKKRRFYLISETLLLILFIVRESRSSFHLCKLSYAGSEYVGKFSQTSSNEPCQSWTDSEPHCAASTFADHTFPDGSKKLANNYCRNPDKNKDGPWCYPLNPMKDREPCKVPTCSNDKCRWTGPGMEYTGPSRESLKNRECSPWSTDSEKFRHLDEFKQSFPEGNRMLASRGCRNPTEDLGGPWCFVVTEEEITNNVQYLKEYCDIPFCFPMDGIAVVDDHPSIHYTHYWDIFHPLETPLASEERPWTIGELLLCVNVTNKSVDIAFKLWAPGDWDGAEIRIGLSSLPLPVTGKEMRDLVFGYEIILRNNNATITRIGDEQEISVNEPGLINGLTWTNLTISWAHGKLCVKLSDRNTPLMLLELMNPSETILDRENIKYISHQSNVLMFLLVNNFAKSTMEKVDVEERLIELEDFCAKHTTNSARFRSYFLLRKARIGRFRDLNLYVRGFNVNIKLTPTPSPHLPYVLLQISSCSCTVSIVHAHAQIVIAREEIQGLLSYWSWSHFEFILSESRLQLFLHFDKRIRIMVDITDRHITPVRWFAVSSNGEAHWTFFCSPDKIKLFEPYPPECISSSLGFEYTGHQSVTQEGNPCFPWIIPHTLDLVDAHFRVDGTILRAVNYCRNPTNDPAGPFCLTRNRNGLLEKSACNVQHCKFMGCRFAGTGDDYFGISTVTRFNKTCQFWTNDKPHLVDHELLKDELFPERCPKNSHNYCRNPSRDVGGPWCYTTDPNVKKDLCNVPDCFEPEACTLIVRGQPSNKIFIDPRKRTYGIKFKAKIWNPLSPTVLTFTFYPKFGKEKMTFEIGAENNQLLRLYFHNKHGRRALLKQFTFPHILFIGKWAGLTLIARQYRFDAKFTESSETFFSWRYSSSLIYYENICRKGRSVSVRPFDPVYFSYGGGSGKTDFIGLSFPCDDCHSEVAERPNTDGVVYYPVNLWSEKACGDSFQDMNLKIHLKGRGNAKITFFNLPSSGHPIIQIILKAVGNHTVIVRNEKIENICDVSNKPELYSETKWTDFQIGARVSKAEGEIRRKGEVISYWKHFYTPVYFFTVEALDDELLWTTTCTPPDTETGALDAGWSEWSDWTCSAKCGGGRGFRTRTCTNPRPSLYGNSCEGKSYMFGLCNTFKCGKISPFTLAELNEELRTVSSIQLKVDQGQTVKIPCSPRRLKMVKNEEPTAMIQWMKNSRPVAPEVQLNGVDENDYSLTVSNVTQQSTGVYACMVHTSDGITTAIEITTVLVLTARPLSMRTGDTLVLPTNALILGKVFNRLTMVWSINSVLYKSSDYYYDIDGNETISPLFEEHEGMWECSIHQNALNLTWTTYLIKVEVVPKPCFSDYLEGSIIQKTLSGNLQNESEFWPLTVSVYVLILGFVYVIVHAMVKKMASHGRTEPSNEDAAVPLMMEERLLSSQTSLGSRKICSQVNPSYQSTPPISPVLDSCDVTTTDQYGNTTTDLFGNTTERYSSA